MRIDPAIVGVGGRSAALVWRLARDFMRPHVARILFAFLLMGLAAGSTAGRAWLMEPVLDRIFVAREGSLLLLIAGGALAFALVKGLADYGEAVLMTRVGQRVIADVQIALFARLMRADLAYFHAHPSGTLISRFTSDAALLRNAAANVLAGIGKDVLTVVFLVGVMFYQDWLLALVSFFVFPLAIRPIVAIGRRIRRVTANAQAEIGQFTTLLSQTFQGARHVKAYGMEPYEERRAAGLIERLFVLIDRGTRTRSRASPMMEALGGTAIAVVILYGGHQVISGARTPGALFSFITALLLAYQPLKSLANLNASLQEGLAAAQRIFEVLDVEPTIRDMPGAKPLHIAGGEIRFDNVRFGYVPGMAAIDGLSLTIPAGHTVALVGPSGAGKSTMLNLIPRFFDIDSGCIAIDGQDVRAVTIASLRSAIALVAQEVSLFDDTVRANIAYGRFGASLDEIEEAARAGCRRCLHPRAAAGLRYHGRRARRPALGRPASANCDCPRDAEERADPSARRSDFGPRQRIGAASATSAEHIDSRAHDARHCASAVDDPGGGPHLRRRSRADRRDRSASRAAGPGRPLCPPL